ncbi:hypothetical protein EI546_12115 [Aequorivita sp. H23M31]|uniref:Transposase n=1 Tax=Aequorivita ciconiae TaxID=2494375 RepID=A0A410G563_9FLAO|nr:hypothetical protein EI546_12115 [Aequorivita sp. H23M31]
MRGFKRTEVNDENYLQILIYFIHCNPVEGGPCNSPGNWQRSSFRAIFSDRHTQLRRKEVLVYFDTLENFLYMNSHRPKLTGVE